MSFAALATSSRFVALGGEDGTEYLLADHRHFGLHVDQDGGVDEIAAVTGGRVAAVEDRGAGFPALIDIVHHPLLLLGRDERAHHRVGGEARADLELGGGGGDA